MKYKIINMEIIYASYDGFGGPRISCSTPHVRVTCARTELSESPVEYRTDKLTFTINEKRSDDYKLGQIIEINP